MSVSPDNPRQPLLPSVAGTSEHRGLSRGEIFWRDHSQWLATEGFLLRSRYQPGWVPSWKGTSKIPMLCPDGLRYFHYHVMDAIRASDQAQVMLKVVNEEVFTHEIAIGELFSSDTFQEHNHCVPILQVLPLPDEERRRIIVMPYLLPSEQPWFDTVGEVVAFCEQMFQGLAFMHQKGVYHGDAKLDNVLMDGLHLFRSSFHPIDPHMTADYSKKSKTYTRTERPVKYYFIDFSLSAIVKPGVDPRRSGSWGGDQSVPEFAIDEPHDPFAVDVYCVGNIVRQLFLYGDPDFDLKPKKGLEFLKPLIDDMCQDDPQKRPKMDEVVARYAEIRKGLNTWTSRSRVADVDESFVIGTLRSLGHWRRRISYILRRKAAIPSI